MENRESTNKSASVQPSPEKKLISFEVALTKMTPEEKANFEKLRADYIKALKLCEPILRELSKRHEAMTDDIARIDEQAKFAAVGFAAAIATVQPWMLGVSTMQNLVTMVDSISANLEKTKIDDLERFSNQLEQASDDLGKRFRKFQKSMREKYTK